MDQTKTTLSSGGYTRSSALNPVNKQSVDVSDAGANGYEPIVIHPLEHNRNTLHQSQ